MPLLLNFNLSKKVLKGVFTVETDLMRSNFYYFHVFETFHT